MKKVKRFNYNIIDAIIGKDLETAKLVCYFNGYKLGGNTKFWSIDYKLNDKNEVIEACLI